MVISLKKLITDLYELFNDGKKDEAWQKIAKWEQSEPLTPEENHKYKMFKGSFLYLTGRVQEGLKIAEEHYLLSKNQNNSLNAIDAFLLKWNILYILGRFFELWENLLSCENLLKSLSIEPQSEIQYRLAMLYLAKAHHLNAIIAHWREYLEMLILLRFYCQCIVLLMYHHF